MSLLDEPRTLADLDATGELPVVESLDPPVEGEQPESEVLDASAFELTPVKPFTAAASAFLAAAAAAWMLGGVFNGQLARAIGVLGAFIGASMVWLGSRRKVPAFVQFLPMPLAAAVGIALVAPDTSSGSITTLISDALHGGGLSQPPAPFDPGWRFLIVVLIAGLAATAASGALAFNKVKLAAFVPAPVIAAGVLIQPDGKELIGVAPSLALGIGALAVAFGSDLARDTGAGARFEVRRLSKAFGLVVVMVAALVGLSQLGFLFPPTTDSTVVPPKRPSTPPKVTGDPLLFTIKQDVQTPLRLGVLDVYDGTAWLTPPYDPKRYVKITDAPVPAFAPDRTSGFDAPQPAPKGKTVTTQITIVKAGAQRQIPDVTGTVSFSGLPKGTKFDPRTQSLQLPGHSTTGTTYTVTSTSPPDAAKLLAAGKPSANVSQFTQAPAPPAAVKAILDRIPLEQKLYDRLQFVRTEFYKKIEASGPGNPVDVTPDRVEAFLTGTDASPYEITASEVLMARWTGVPARIGYGYYNPDAKPNKDGRVEVHSSDGAMWLEAYFEGSGWTPILGKPPKATAALNTNKKNTRASTPNGLITAQLYIPIEQEGVALLYRIVQFWLVRVAVVIGLGIFFWLLLPMLIKGLRRVLRRRWAERRGPRARLAVAYADLRDRAIDFNMGHPTLTPLEFLDVIEPDDDHAQLAWLVTRGLWGDLARDLRPTDVEAAETMSRSLTRRVVQGQPFLTRVVAVASRASLLDPWDRTLPNPYWKRSIPSIVISGVRRTARTLTFGFSLKKIIRRIKLRRVLAQASSIVALLAIFLTGCVQSPDLKFDPAKTPALPKVPAKVESTLFQHTTEGDKQFVRSAAKSLIADFDVYVVRQDNVAVGTLQTSAFKPGLKAENRKVREGVLTSLGGTPTISRVNGQVFYTVIVNDLHLIVWFPPDGLTYQLLAATKDIADPTGLFAKLIAVEQGKDASSVSTAEGAAPTDVRRGTA